MRVSHIAMILKGTGCNPPEMSKGNQLYNPARAGVAECGGGWHGRIKSDPVPPLDGPLARGQREVLVPRCRGRAGVALT